MTASASRTVASASVTRFIENLPCNHCDGRNEGSTAGREYSGLGKLSRSDSRADAAADGIIFQLFPVWPRAQPQASLAALVKLFVRPKSEGPLQSLGISRPDLW